MTMKQETIRHYRRMIKWAKTQKPKAKVNDDKMIAEIDESWGGDYCPYCQACTDCQFNLSGKECPLFEGNPDYHCCCNGLWGQLNQSPTWGTWIKRAEKVMEYIKENG